MFSIPVSYNWKSKREKMVAIVRYSSAMARLHRVKENTISKEKLESAKEPDGKLKKG